MGLAVATGASPDDLCKEPMVGIISLKVESSGEVVKLGITDTLLVRGWDRESDWRIRRTSKAIPLGVILRVCCLEVGPVTVLSLKGLELASSCRKEEGGKGTVSRGVA